MLASWKKVMTNLDSILKSRDITWPTKLPIVKVMVFLVIMYGCESWTIKKAERQRIDAFQLWCWRRLLRFPRISKRSNQSIFKESESCSLVSYLLWPYGLYSSWNSPGQNTGVDRCFLLQGIFPTQGSHPTLQANSLAAEPTEKPLLE